MQIKLFIDWVERISVIKEQGATKLERGGGGSRVYNKTKGELLKKLFWRHTIHREVFVQPLSNFCIRPWLIFISDNIFVGLLNPITMGKNWSCLLLGKFNSITGYMNWEFTANAVEIIDKVNAIKRFDILCKEFNYVDTITVHWKKITFFCVSLLVM